MSTNNSLRKNRCVIIIWILSLVILIFSILYFAERNKYSNQSQKLEQTNLYLYELEVKSPLVILLNYLGARPVEAVDWDEEVVSNDIQHILRELDSGLTNIYNPALQNVPNDIQLQLHDLQDKLYPILKNVYTEEPFDEQSKVAIMNLSEAVSVCDISEIIIGWDQVKSKLECMNAALVN